MLNPKESHVECLYHPGSNGIVGEVRIEFRNAADLLWLVHVAKREAEDYEEIGLPAPPLARDLLAGIDGMLTLARMDGKDD